MKSRVFHPFHITFSTKETSFFHQSMIPTFQVNLRTTKPSKLEKPSVWGHLLSPLDWSKIDLSGDTLDIPSWPLKWMFGCLFGVSCFFLHFVPARLVRFFTSCATLGAYRRCEVPRQPCGHAPAITREESNPSVSWWFRFIHPGRLTWNLRMHPWKRKIIFQTIIFRFYVNLQGCNWLVGWMFFLLEDSRNSWQTKNSKRWSSDI